MAAFAPNEVSYSPVQTVAPIDQTAQSAQSIAISIWNASAFLLGKLENRFPPLSTPVHQLKALGEIGTTFKLGKTPEYQKINELTHPGEAAQVLVVYGHIHNLYGKTEDALNCYRQAHTIEVKDTDNITRDGLIAEGYLHELNYKNLNDDQEDERNKAKLNALSCYIQAGDAFCADAYCALAKFQFYLSQHDDANGNLMRGVMAGSLWAQYTFERRQFRQENVDSQLSIRNVADFGFLPAIAFLGKLGYEGGSQSEALNILFPAAEAGYGFALDVVAKNFLEQTGEYSDFAKAFTEQIMHRKDHISRNFRAWLKDTPTLEQALKTQIENEFKLLDNLQVPEPVNLPRVYIK